MNFYSVLSILVTFAVSIHSSEGTECHNCIPSGKVKAVCATVAGITDVTFQNINALMCNIACGLDAEYKNMGSCAQDKLDGKLPPYAGVTCLTCITPTNVHKPVCGESMDGYVRKYETLRHAVCAGYCGPKIKIVSNERCGLP